MSWQPADEPICPDASCDVIEVVITPRPSDLGAFEVKRALPSVKKRMIGPFIFFDQFGPTVLEAGRAMDVRPHPHIGLATITWLIEGEILHRDSLGVVQTIRPGEVNWMTAGSGIVHSERSPESQRDIDCPLYGLQTWVALPEDQAECQPDFSHYGAGDIPALQGEGWAGSLIIGSLFGQKSPVKTASETVYADFKMTQGAIITLPGEIAERGLYVLSGGIEIGGEAIGDGTLVALKGGPAVSFRATADSQVFLIGGEPMDGPRNVYWNFVSSSKERIEKAKADWREGRFPKVPGDDDYIPLPAD
ncbi:MAG: pirin family protein [Magnetovibrionaceae bacterium]